MIQPASRSIAWGLAALLLAACGSETEPPAAGGGGGAPAPGSAGSSATGAAGTSPAVNAGNGSQMGSTVVAGTAAAAAGASGANGASGSGGSSAAGAPAAGSGMAAAGGAGGSGAGAPAPMTAGTGGAAAAPAAETVPTLYWLDINANRVMRSINFARGEAVVTRTGTAPDGVAVDVEGKKLYWTNMGSLLGTGGGTLQRANLDGTGVETIVMQGIAQTPKQMQIDLVNKHVYWCDREGAKVWRANMDGTMPQAIVSGHGYRELVGVALDVPNGKFYFSDRIGGKILRANIQMPAGQTGADRTDIEDMFVFSGNAMPIDLDIDHENKHLYWTDRNLGSVQQAGLDVPAGQTAMNRTDAKTLVMGLVEPIGISLDIKNNKMYFTELGGTVGEAALDGSGKKDILSSGSATGVAIAHIPK